MAAAIGAGMPITEPSGNMVVDIGGGTTDIAVISLAGIVYSRSVRVAGNEMDEAIIQYVKKTLQPAHRRADRRADQDRTRLRLPARRAARRWRSRAVTSSRACRRRSRSPTRRSARRWPRRSATIVDAVRDRARAHSAGAVAPTSYDRGIVLTGGGALLKNLDKRLREETGLPVAMAEDPLSSVVLGAGQDAVGLRPAAEDLDRLVAGFRDSGLGIRSIAEFQVPNPKSRTPSPESRLPTPEQC